MFYTAAAIWAAACAGRVVVRRMFGSNALSPGERNLYGAAVGLGILAYGVLAIGLLGLLKAWILSLWIAALAAVGFKEHAPLAHDILSSVASLKRLTKDDKWCLTACLFLGLFMLLGATAPPSGSDWDGLSYHLAAPKVYLQQGRIFFIPYDHHTNFPFTVEMLYTLGLALASPGAARVFHTVLGLLCALGIGLFWSRFVGPRFAALPPLIFLSTPLVSWSGTVAYNDLGMALYAFLAAFGVAAWLDEGRRRWPLLAGVCAGFALGTKMTAMVPTAILGAWILALSGKPAGKRLKELAVFILPAVLIGSPWYIKTWLWTGNPVYPFFYSVFGGVNWDAEAARMYAQEQGSFGVERGLVSFLMLPYSLTFRPELFSKGVGVFGSPGPVYLSCILPLLPLSRPVNRQIAALSWFSLVYVIVWFFLTQQSRYLLCITPMLSLLAAWTLTRGFFHRRTQAISIFAFALQILVLTLLLFSLIKPSLPAVFGAVSADRYLEQTLDVYPAQRWINENTPPSARILLFEETRGFYLDRPYMWANPGHHT
ncbi:MAG: ArnT family glycosyltransferase, partial [Armatimonadota bacterium]